MPEHILHSSREWTLEDAGGKGASLNKLIRSGFNVPPAFCISTWGYRQFMVDNGIKHLAMSAKTEKAAFRVREKILSCHNPTAVQNEICSALNKFLTKLPAGATLAVRSSATCEDLPDLSFAGQHDSFINLTDHGEILGAVKKCWASLWTDRAVSYRRAHGIDDRKASMAVIVQLMVKAKNSGVIFTVNPVNGRAGQMLVNTAKGLGDKLVSGRVSPDEYLISKEDGLITSRSSGNAPVLSENLIKELCLLAQKIETLFGAPQDLDWAHDGKQFWFLQSRSITAINKALDSVPDVQWGNPVNQKLSHGRVIFWSN